MSKRERVKDSENARKYIMFKYIMFNWSYNVRFIIIYIDVIPGFFCNTNKKIIKFVFGLLKQKSLLFVIRSLENQFL